MGYTAAKEIIEGHHKIKNAFRETKMLTEKEIDTIFNRDMLLSFSRDVDGMVSYAKEKKYRLQSRRRIRTRLGRFCRKFEDIWKGHKDSYWSNLFLKVDSKIFPKNNWEILRGDDVVIAYREGYGDWSCMCESSSRYTTLYAENPDKVGMLVLNDDDGNPIGRAILWTDNEGRTIVDRVYPSEQGPQYEEWAKANGAYIREHHSCIDFCEGEKMVGVYDPSNGNYINPEITVKSSDLVFPYLDTFHFGEVNISGDRPTFTLFNEDEYASNETYVFRNQRGGYSGPQLFQCVFCDKWGRDGDGHMWFPDGHGGLVCTSCMEERSTCSVCGKPSWNLEVRICKECYEDFEANFSSRAKRITICC